MAQFHINQRVRIVDEPGVFRAARGKEGTVCAMPGAHPRVPDAYGVRIDDVPPEAGAPLGLWWAREADMRPLTDPKCTEFIERMKLENIRARVFVLRAENACLDAVMRTLYPEELGGVRGGAL